MATEENSNEHPDLNTNKDVDTLREEIQDLRFQLDAQQFIQEQKISKLEYIYHRNISCLFFFVGCSMLLMSNYTGKDILEIENTADLLVTGMLFLNLGISLYQLGLASNYIYQNHIKDGQWRDWLEG